MTSVVQAIIPIVLIVLAGFIAGRRGIVRADLRKPLIDFCLYFGIPALVVRTVARTDISFDVSYGVCLAYLASAAFCWILASSVTAIGSHTLAASSVAMASTYGNVLMLGIPLAIIQFGAEASAIISMIVLVHSPVLFAVAAIHSTLEMSRVHSERSVHGALRAHPTRTLFSKLGKIFGDLFGNPIILAIVVGFGIRLSGLSLPPLLDKMLEILGQGTLPCVLIAVGVGLSSFKAEGQLGFVFTIVALKMLTMPVMAWWICSEVLHLDALSVAVVTFLSAMPVGANALAFAEGSSYSLDTVSAGVATSTILSPITLGIVLWALWT